MDYLELNGNKYEVSGYDKDGVPIIKAKCITKEEINTDGTIKKSVEVIVPCAIVGTKVGQNGGV